eukprot:g31961.t1
MTQEHLAAAAAGGLAALLLWKRCCWKRESERVNVVHVPASGDVKEKKTVIVMIPGMWHGAWYFKTLQTLLSKRGFSSYALDLPSARGCFAAELLRRAVSALTELRQLGQLQQVVLLGHSQGGILLQTLLRGTALEDASLHVQGAVLSATVPISSLGAGMAMMSHKTNVFKEYGLVAFVYYLFTGRVWDASLVQRLFLLPTTEESARARSESVRAKRPRAVVGLASSSPAGCIMPYGSTATEPQVEKILAAPCDGWPTTEHPFWLRPSFAHRASLPVLVLGAEEDARVTS